MSYQPVPAVTEPPRRRGTALIWLGVLCIVGGIGAGIGLYFADQQRFDTRVTRLAEDAGALSGCVTDLTFTKEGTFVLYYLSEGRVQVNGANDGCADSDSVRISADADPPDMEITLTDADGDDVRISRTDLDEDTTLEAGGVVARPYRAVDIDRTGDYEIEITAADDVDRFAIGLGPEIEEPNLTVPVLVAGIGAALGVLLIVIGGVRRNLPGREPQGTAVGVGYPGVGGYQAQPPYQQQGAQGYPPYQQPGAPGGYQAPGQYPQQPPVVYQPPGQQGFDHPTQAMPPIVSSPDGVGQFAAPPGGAPPSGPPAGGAWAAPPPPVASPPATPPSADTAPSDEDPKPQ